MIQAQNAPCASCVQVASTPTLSHLGEYLRAGWACYPNSLLTAHFCAQEIYIKATRGQLVQ